jgi:hypothetical protein
LRSGRVAVHREIDVAIGRLLVFLEQGDRAHHLARLAVAALRHVARGPGRLDRLGLAAGIASIVVISAPATAETGVTQERSGLPSR